MKPLCLAAVLLALVAAPSTHAASAVQHEFGTRYDKAARQLTPGFSVYSHNKPQINTRGFLHANGVEVRNGRTLLVNNGGYFVKEGIITADLRKLKPSRKSFQNRRTQNAGKSMVVARNNTGIKHGLKQFVPQPRSAKRGLFHCIGRALSGKNNRLG